MLQNYRSAIWQQWDKQEAERRSNQAFINLNNLYLSVESGKTPMSITTMNELFNLLSIAYPYRTEPTMNEYWKAEFEKLPDWYKF